MQLDKVLPLLCVSVALTSCALVPARDIDKELHPHLLSVDPDGNISRYGEEDGADTNCAQFDQLERQVDLISEAIADRGPERVLIFVHGGLNLPRLSVRRLVEQVPQIASYVSRRDQVSRASSGQPDRSKPYYPLFLTWPSGGVSTYTEQVFSFRDGRRTKNAFYGPLTSPAFIFEDIVEGVARAPGAYAKLLARYTRIVPVKVADLERCGDHHDGAAYELGKIYADKSKREGGSKHEFKNIKVRACFSGSDRTGQSAVGNRTLIFLTAPLKVVTAPFTASIGRTSWDGMLRRTQTLFHNPFEFDDDQQQSCAQRARGTIEGELGHNKGSGALAVLMNKLEQEHNDKKYTIVGHSMGAIILNGVLQRFPTLNVERIVYMAPASRIDDTINAVVPFMQRHPNTHLYIQTLHPDAEATEFNNYGLVGGVLPSGSLLEWIDEMYGYPVTPLQRMLGKWDNLSLALHQFPDEVAERVHIKVFGFEESCPNKHGEFDDIKYWIDDFRELTSNSEASCIASVTTERTISE